MTQKFFMRQFSLALDHSQKLVIYGWSLYLYDSTPFSMIGQQVSTSSTVFLTFSICLRNLKYANLNILTVVRQQQISFALLQSKSAALVVTPSILLNTLKHFIDNIFVLRYWFDLTNSRFPIILYSCMETSYIINQRQTRPKRIYNPITAMEFSAMFTFQLDNTKR